jgi:translation initiation factor 2 subunit 2
MGLVNPAYFVFHGFDSNEIEAYIQSAIEAGIPLNQIERKLDFVIDINDEKALTQAIKDSKPDIIFDKSKKTVWKNFKIIQEQINREENHILKFFSKEYNKTTSVNKNGHFLISGKYINMINNTLKKYIKIYVQCGTCRSIKTNIIKNYKMGIDYKKCFKCNGESPIID